MLNDRGPNPHVCIVSSDRLISKYVTFSSNILLLDLFSLEFFILHSSIRAIDDVQMEWKGSRMNLKLANHIRRQVERVQAISSPLRSLGRS